MKGGRPGLQGWASHRLGEVVQQYLSKYVRVMLGKSVLLKKNTSTQGTKIQNKYVYCGAVPSGKELELSRDSVSVPWAIVTQSLKTMNSKGCV